MSEIINDITENTSNESLQNNLSDFMPVGVKKSSKIKKVFKIVGYTLLVAVLACMLLNTFFTLFKPHYYPTFGKYRLFAIVTDSMEPEIKTGDMIVCRVPKAQEEIGVGTVITFEMKVGNTTRLVTHRVTKIAYNQETGEWAFKTKGDNAAGEDGGYRNFSNVVGIYTGRHCGFFGYMFGFLQSTNGAIALIVIMLILLLWIIVSNYVNFISIWKKLTEKVLVKSRQVLADDNNKADVVSDVINIIITEPKNKKDAKLKSEQLNYFLQYGVLSPLPYNEWFSQEDIEYIRRKDEEFVEDDIDGFNQRVSDVIAEAIMGNSAEEQHVNEVASTVVTEDEDVEIVDVDFEDGDVEVTEDKVPDYVANRRLLYYNRSFLAKLIQLSEQSKEWYTVISNEMLSFKRVYNNLSWKRETFMCGRKTVARLIVRGKTLCLLLAVDPKEYVGSKYGIEDISEIASYASTPSMMRIRSDRKAKYAIQLIKEIMNKIGTQKRDDFTPNRYALDYDDIDGLAERGLAIRVSSQVISGTSEQKSADRPDSTKLEVFSVTIDGTEGE